jgi:thiamine biosynthesis lipoprotein
MMTASGWAHAAESKGPSKALIWQEKLLQGFGTTLWLRAGHADEGVLHLALSEAVQAIRHVEQLMSLFDEHSALSQLNRQGFLQNPHPDLFKILTLSQTISQKSRGAFDVTMQPIWLAWTAWLKGQGIEAFDQKTVHSSPHSSPFSSGLPKDLRARLAAACQQVGWEGLSVAPDLIRLRAGMAVSLNGIAQGFASDAAKAALQRRGIRQALLDVGETTLLGESADGPWRLGMESVRGHEPAPVWVGDGRAIATSSEAHTAFSADRRFHHIVNPHTGLSPTHWASVSVIAPSCTLADGLTKVFFMTPPEKIQPLAAYWGVDAVLQDKTGRWQSTAKGA